MATITDEKKVKEALQRGVEDIIVGEELEKKMLSGQKLRLYFGIDPTGFDLHLGHAVALRKLRQFQDLGHEVILLIGDFTARIGDPTGKDAARLPLDEKQIKANMKDYQKQASKILDFKRIKINYNSKWLSKLAFADILKLSANFTVQQMIQRDMFQRRMADNMPISVSEFMYPLMQGYDSVAMDVDLEIGGNDQMFNMLAGRTLQKIYNNRDKNVLTVKLLMGLDGRKMSKTYGNFVGICEDPKNMFGKIMSMKDELIDDYFELATDLSKEEIDGIKSSSGNPRDIKARLAKEIVKMYHGQEAAEGAEEEFNKVFKNKELPSDMPELVIERGKKYNILDLLCLPAGRQATPIAASKNEAKRLVEGNAVEIISGEKKNKITDWRAEAELHDGDVIKAGSRRFARIKLNA